MSETTTRYRISEIDAVRVVCKHCENVVETSLGKLADVFRKSGNDYMCRFCNAEVKLSDPLRFDPFHSLNEVAKAFASVTDDIEIQLVFPHQS